jgi:hypothetical protein
MLAPSKALLFCFGILIGYNDYIICNSSAAKGNSGGVINLNLAVIYSAF